MHKVNKSSIWVSKFMNVYGGGLPWRPMLDNIYRPPRNVNENEIFIDEVKHEVKHVISILSNNDVICHR